ncbi:MAG: hypothetical protein GXP39_08075 [Chloroflexi bacterium]|nr:hypothetical protein [Chloroflexota bacterium]
MSTSDGKTLLLLRLEGDLEYQEDELARVKGSIAVTEAAVELWGYLGDEEELNLNQSLLRGLKSQKQKIEREIAKLEKAIDVLTNVLMKR